VGCAESKLVHEKYLKVYNIRHDLWCEELEKVKAASANINRWLYRRAVIIHWQNLLALTRGIYHAQSIDTWMTYLSTSDTVVKY